MKTLDEFRAEIATRRPVTTAEEIRVRLADRETEEARRRQKVSEKRASYPRRVPPTKATRQSTAAPQYVRLTQPCLSQVFHTYLKAGELGQVVGRANGKLHIRFDNTLAVIAEDSPLIEVVK